MKKILPFILFLFLFTSKTYSQSKEMLENMTESEIKEKIADEQAVRACDCIDKFYSTEKDPNKINIKINDCITASAKTYQLAKSLASAYTKHKKKGSSNMNIFFGVGNFDADSFFAIEKSLFRNCNNLQEYSETNNYVYPNSVSNKKIALDFFIEGQASLHKKEYDKAIKSFKLALKNDENFSFAWDNLGIAYYSNSEHKKAIKAFQHSLKIAPNGLYPLLYIPRVYLELKNYNKSVENYQKALNIHPNNYEANIRIAYLYFNELKDKNSSFKYFCKAYKITKERGSSLEKDIISNVTDIYNNTEDISTLTTFDQILKENNIIITKLRNRDS